MPLLLSQDDLRPVVTDPDAMENAFAAIEQAYREYQRGESRPIDTLGLPVTGAQRALRVCPGASGSGVSLRMYPVVGRDQYPDSSVNVLFDPDSGRLLAVMAGDDINLFRTAVPGAVAARYLAPPRPAGPGDPWQWAPGPRISARNDACAPDVATGLGLRSEPRAPRGLRSRDGTDR